LLPKMSIRHIHWLICRDVGQLLFEDLHDKSSKGQGNLIILLHLYHGHDDAFAHAERNPVYYGIDQTCPIK
jgi:hypothetical protein